jgi:hypothetical protein
LATKLADRGYIVFNVNYRLACTDPLINLCGFNFSVQPQDVKDAMHWVRTHASHYALFSNRMVAIGTSAGGNLVFMSGAVGVPGDSRPDVMAGLSGHPEMGYMSDSFAACVESDQPFICDQNSTAYMNASLDTSHVQCGDNWRFASPACNVSDTSPPPPTFIGNSSNELSAFLAAQDFDFKLTHVVPPVADQLCKVSQGGGHLHGTQLLGPDVHCDGLTDTVYDEMINFIESH